MTNQNTLALGGKSANPQTFNFDNLPVRTVDKDGVIWFVANDVCTVLEISNPRQAVSRLDDDERAPVIINDTPSKNQHGDYGTQEQTVNIISESGLYALVLTSVGDA